MLSPNLTRESGGEVYRVWGSGMEKKRKRRGLECRSPLS